jgi:hypothetical protein
MQQPIKQVQNLISEDTLMNLADSMAAAATTIGSSVQNYELFIQARTDFQHILHDHYTSLD